MRLPVEKIKEAILHPEEEVRLTAVKYFADSSSDDVSVMPLVIQAVEKYGQGSAFRILRDAEHLVQTASTLDWLINELRQTLDPQSIDEDNLRFALALVLLAAPVDLLAARKTDVDALSNFPNALRGPIDERIQMATWTWDQAWEALEESARRTMKKRDVTSNDIRYMGRLIETLARHPDRANWVIDRLRGQCGTNNRLTAWLESEVVELAGEMRLEAAVPILIEYLGSDDSSLSYAAATALMKICTDAVVEAIADEWWDWDDDFRGAAADVLEKIHTDLCVATCLELLDGETDLDTALALGHALLSNFAMEAIDPVRELVAGDDDDLSPDECDLRYHLTAAATIMKVQFPEYDAWYRDALETNWGWGDYSRNSVADAFRPQPVRSKRLGTGEARLPIAKIKQSLLHSDHEVREAALFYFAKSRSNDPTIMPIVIQAIEQFGLDAFPILSATSSIQALVDFVQTDDTVAWLIREIERVGLSADVVEANYVASLIRALRSADFFVLKRHAPKIQALRALDDGSRGMIADRISVSSLTPDVLWRELIDFCDADPDPEELPAKDFEHIGSVVQALARFPDQIADRVLSTLADEDDSNEWLEGLTIRLAGELRLEAAIPSLVDRFTASDWICAEAHEALARIGTDGVVEEIAAQYLESEWDFRLSAATTLEDIHTDLVVPTCLDLFEQEEEVDLKGHLLQSALMNFSAEAIEPARQYILHTQKTPDVLEVRTALLVACKLMDQTFPEFEEWLQDSQHDVEFRREWYEQHPLTLPDWEDDYDEEFEDDEFAEAFEEDDSSSGEGHEPPFTIVRRGERVGRNDPCPCGSGKKYKKCCYGKDSALEETDEVHSTVMSGVRPIKSPTKYPVGTVAYYGPDNKITTKIVAGVIKRDGADAVIERWVGMGVKNSPRVQRQIKEFFDRHKVKSVVATDTNFGCPHEEGLDFPSGGDCPFCPYWAGKQGSNRRD